MWVAGIDEAGRGPCIGPLVVAIVAIPQSDISLLEQQGIDDSKKLSAQQRERAFKEIFRKAHIAVGIVSESAIDRMNILNATSLAMEKAITRLMRHKFKKICFIVDVLSVYI